SWRSTGAASAHFWVHTVAFIPAVRHTPPTLHASTALCAEPGSRCGVSRAATPGTRAASIPFPVAPVIPLPPSPRYKTSYGYSTLSTDRCARRAGLHAEDRMGQVQSAAFRRGSGHHGRAGDAERS